MSREIVRRPLVEEDLIEIWSYIADNNENAADDLLQTSKPLSDDWLSAR